MASLPGFRFNITGASGSLGLLGPKNSWRTFILPRGGYASQSSSGQTITFDSTAIAARFAANDWIQVSTPTANIRQVMAVGGNSITVNTAVTVTENDRVFLIGQTQPTVNGGSATYTTPNTLIRQRSDDASDLYTNSMITSDSDGLIYGYASPAMYDGLVQDGNQSNQGFFADMEVGSVEGISTAEVSYFGATVVITAGLSVSGTIIGSTLVITGPWIIPTHPKYGALGGNSSSIDDRAAIQAALYDAATTLNGSQGGVVLLPRDTFHVSSQLIVPNKVRLVGMGRRNSVIKAGDSWTGGGSGSAVVRLGGTTDTDVFNCTVEQLWIDGNSKASIMGVYSTGCNEGSGIFDVLISNFIVAGISFNSTSNRNFSIRGLECYHAGTTAYGMMLTCGEQFAVEDVTLNSNTGATSSNPGIQVTSGNFYFRKIHSEDHATGIQVSGSARGCIDTAIGGNNTDVIVQLDNEGVNCFNIVPNSTPMTSIYNTITGTSHNATAGIQYYLYSDFGSIKSVITSDDKINNYQNAPWAFGTTVTHVGQAGFSGSIVSAPANLSASSDSITVGTRNLVHLGGAGTFNITSIIGGYTGQKVDFSVQAGAAGTYTFTDGNTLFLAGNFTLGAMDSLTLRCFNGVSWYEVCRSNN